MLGNTICLFLVMPGGAFAQEQGQRASEAPVKKIEPEKEQKKELREKACGTESVNYETSTDKKQHPTPEAPSDKALIYVMRPTMIGFKIDSKLAVDGEWMGVNRGKTYFYFTLEPGEHFFLLRVGEPKLSRSYCRSWKNLLSSAESQSWHLEGEN